MRAREEFACFGGTCTVAVEGDGARGPSRDAAVWAKTQLLTWHQQFTRFDPTSELSALNADSRTEVPATPLMRALARAVRMAGEVTDGLVDGTLTGALSDLGYAKALPEALRWSPGDDPEGAPAQAHAARHWSTILVDDAAGTIARAPGVQLDSGGLVKGLLADVLTGWLSSYDDVVVECCGDVRFGGAEPGLRDLEATHPSGGLAGTLEVEEGGAATSGTTNRRWLGADGLPAHHLLDPRTGRPAFTGLVQVTALAPTALEAEVLAKWALLGGPHTVHERLPHGGLVVHDSGAVDHIPAQALAVTPS